MKKLAIKINIHPLQIALAAVRSKAVVLLLFIHRLVLLTLFVAVLCYFMSFLVLQSSRWSWLCSKCRVAVIVL